ncbi:3-oxoacyl-ACP synthase [Streptococcus bovimastitidis]|uniref:Beta-ketoacyl-[acyl-carrier-protein] synthase III n=1 Tax=Streptococcus bovimastitidis TaxID=1856638 RepID=A0A1L8MLG3_9STRE|nr:beta-ketoacyl-ACP synthase III [Streptococcus bovimastitidis]OJF71579.1 3-oxoacyl-ACP synthase [Streptococcus bovimastitidis]
MPYSKISQVAHYLPEQVVSNQALADILDTNDEWISSRTGIKNRRISQNQSTSDLASQVALQLLEKSGMKAETIDFIIVATISADSIMPSVAAKVQATIGATNAFAFDLTAACSGFVFALAMADKLISSGAYCNGLVIGAETLSKSLDWTDRSTAVLFGDGAGGVLLESSEQKHILAESLNTDGSRGSSLTSGQNSLNSPFSEKSDSDPFIHMDGRAIFDFAIRDVSKNIKQLIEDSGLEKDGIDYFLLHQANQRILDKMARKIACPREKFLENMMDYGNTSAASIPILLSESVAKGSILLDGSQVVLFSGFGGGLTWGSLIVKI